MFKPELIRLSIVVVFVTLVTSLGGFCGESDAPASLTVVPPPLPHSVLAEMREDEVFIGYYTYDQTKALTWEKVRRSKRKFDVYGIPCPEFKPQRIPNYRSGFRMHMNIWEGEDLDYQYYAVFVPLALAKQRYVNVEDATDRRTPLERVVSDFLMAYRREHPSQDG